MKVFLSTQKLLLLLFWIQVWCLFAVGINCAYKCKLLSEERREGGREGQIEIERGGGREEQKARERERQADR